MKPLTLNINGRELKFYQQSTLFDPPILEALKQGKCPYCSNKLYKSLNGKMYYCKSVKHKNRFIVAANKVERYEKETK